MPRNISTSETFRKEQEDGLVERVNRALLNVRIEEDQASAKQFVKDLKAKQFFGPARQYLALARRKFPGALWFGQQHALCTYKDTELLADARLDRALAILNEVDSPATTTSSETLGLAGAIYKNKWSVDGQREHLDMSLGYYLRGYEIEQRVENFPPDRYTAINAAYVLDLIADLEQANSKIALPLAQARRLQARQIREEIRTVSLLAWNEEKRHSEAQQWWFLVTLAEACFGLGSDEDRQVSEAGYTQARNWIGEALKAERSDWEFETFARQLAAVAKMQERVFPDRGDAINRTLRTLLGEVGDISFALAGLRAGKTGLALSGGGFRASFFHIGVLARLAELDVLRHVEVLSCVSGGSIVGAFYYLEVRRLLKSKHDKDISRQDYLDIVRSIETKFLTGVQRDLRNQLFADRNVRRQALTDPSYTHTRRLGELFEEQLYSLVDDGEGQTPRYLDELIIEPCGEQQGFAPKIDNWKRGAKVPILILNATALNSGHNWQFTATWMGEPPTAIDTEIDANHRLRRLYYWQAEKTEFQKFRLGYAVAASAAVPLLFDPLNMAGLYEGQELQLSDGGLHDNQGSSALLGEDCTVILVSDGSGQLTSQKQPGIGRVSVLRRANDILQERVRGSEYRELVARRRARLIRDLLFVHLTKDLDGDTTSWIGEVTPREPDEVKAEPSDKYRTNYVVLREVQLGLSRLRTDLDAFTEREAYGLMLSGYRMVSREFPRCVQSFPKPDADKVEPWKFNQLTAVIANTGRDHAPDFVKDLRVGASVIGKSFQVFPDFRRAVLHSRTIILSELGVLMLAAVSALILLLRNGKSGVVIGAGGALGLALGLAGAWTICQARRRMRSGKSLSQVLIGLLLLLGGGFVLSFYLREIAPLYLRWGRISREMPDSVSVVKRWHAMLLPVYIGLALPLVVVCVWFFGKL